MKIKLILILTLLFTLQACNKDQLSELDFLTGKWKIENIDQFEVWEKNTKNGFDGYSYKINNGEKIIL
ncbi:MAG: hypothetical protein HQ541_18875 [Mariniphaga sp.]|nr:hypothetical protein [Mariniphaga sp.]